jgi:hypothetical protein
MPELESGSIFAGYRIERPIGRGGMGIVYEAIELALDRRVALKLIADEAARDPAFRDRFGHESRIAAQVEHPNVIPIYAVGEEHETPFIAMRLIPGQDLGHKIAALRRLEGVDAAHVIAQIAAGLDAIHAAGLVHRDVKPSNVLLSGPEGRELAYLTDFGLAKHVASTSELTRGGYVMGSLDYVSPEQIQGGEVDARTDVYALGCVLYKALTGEVPFPREDGAAKMWAHVNDDFAPPSETAGVPEALDPVLARALAKRPENRYPSAGDLGHAAEAAAAGRPVTQPERRVATGEAATPTRTRALELGEGTTADLARRYAAEERKQRRAQVKTGWRARLPILIGVAAAIIAGVGASLLMAGDEEPEEASPAVRLFIGQADEICAESRGRYNAAATPQPRTTTEAVGYADRLARISQDALALLRDLNVPEEVRADFRDYLLLRRAFVDRLRAARDAAARDDPAGFAAAFERLHSTSRLRYRAARRVGLNQCSRSG